MRRQTVLQRRRIRAAIESLECRKLLSADLTGAFIGRIPSPLPLQGANHLTFELENTGDAPASGSVQLTLSASPTPTPGGGAIALTTISRNIHINAGGNEKVALKFNSPTGATDGDYFLVADIVPGASIGDTNADNNIVASGSTVSIRRAFVDLTGTTSSNAPSTVNVGAAHQKPFTDSVLVKNLGNSAAKGPLTITLFASTGMSHSNSDTELGSKTFGANIAAQKSKKFTIKFTPSSAVPSGTLFILADINSSGSIEESDTTNNIAAPAVAETFVNPLIPPGPRLGGALESTVQSVIVGQSQLSDFSIQITGATASTTVAVEEFDSAGDDLGTFTNLTDDGNAANGDNVAGDGIFSGVNTVAATALGSRHFAAIVSDPSLAQPLKSPIIDISEVNAPSQASLQADLTDNTNLNTDAANIIDAGGSDQAAIAAVQNGLAGDANVIPGSVKTTDTSIEWQTADGTFQGVSTDFLSQQGDLGGGAAAPEAAGQAITIHPAAASSGDPTENALVLSPFATSLAATDPSTQINNAFSAANYTVTFHTDAQVTFGDFQNLGQYDAVELYGHGAKLPGGGEGVYLNQPVTVDTLLNNAISLLNGWVVIMNGRYVITPGYIREFAGNMNGAIVEFNACNSLFDTAMGDAFLQQGAGAYLGYTSRVKAAFAAPKAISTWQTLLGPTSNTVGDIPGIITDHDTNTPAAFFNVDGPLTAKLPQPDLLKNEEVFVQYNWPQNVSDLDSNTGFLGASAGFNLPGSQYLNWGGDNTGSGGSETTTVNINQSSLDGAWSNATSVSVGADWFTPAGGSGPAFVTVALKNTQTGKLTQVTNATVNPGQETAGAATVVGTVKVVLGGDLLDPSVTINFVPA